MKTKFSILFCLLKFIFLSNNLIAQNNVEKLQSKSIIEREIVGRKFGVGSNACDPYTYSEYGRTISFNKNNLLTTDYFSFVPYSSLTQIYDTGYYKIADSSILIVLNRSRFTIDTFKTADTATGMDYPDDNYVKSIDTTYLKNDSCNATFEWCDYRKLTMICPIFKYDSINGNIVRIPRDFQFIDTVSKEILTINFENYTCNIKNFRGDSQQCEIVTSSKIEGEMHLCFKVPNSSDTFVLSIIADKSKLTCRAMGSDFIQNFNLIDSE